MAIITEGTAVGDFIVSEANGYRSRDTIIIAASQTLVAGEVLGKVTASGHYVALDEGAATGEEVAAAILIAPVTTGAGETAEAAVIRREAEVNDAELVFPTGISAGDRATAITQLANLGIHARAAV